MSAANRLAGSAVSLERRRRNQGSASIPVDRDRHRRRDHRRRTGRSLGVEMTLTGAGPPAPHGKQRQVDLPAQVAHPRIQIGVAGEVRRPRPAQHVADRFGRYPERPPPHLVHRRHRAYRQRTDGELLAGHDPRTSRSPLPRSQRSAPAGATTGVRSPSIRSEPRSAWSACRCDSSTQSTRPRVPESTGGAIRTSGPTRPRSTGSVITRTPSSSSSTVACPSHVTSRAAPPSIISIV